MARQSRVVSEQHRSGTRDGGRTVSEREHQFFQHQFNLEGLAITAISMVSALTHDHANHHRLLAWVLGISIVFALCFSFFEINQRMGEEALRTLFFELPGSPRVRTGLQKSVQTSTEFETVACMSGRACLRLEDNILKPAKMTVRKASIATISTRQEKTTPQIA